MSFVEDLVGRSVADALRHRARAIAVIGLTPASLAVTEELRNARLGDALLGIFDPRSEHPPARPWEELVDAEPDLLVIGDDAGKEQLLRACRDALRGRPVLPAVVLAGTGHLEFANPIFDELDAPALVPSYATGYPYTRVHLFQCLLAAAAAGLRGAVVEFGAFKGGTTAWLARAVQRLGLTGCPVIGFDTWDGFPPRASLLDLYEHPRCVFSDLEAVRGYVEPLGVELVPGDITQTVPRRLAAEPVLLAFVDTDNYSGARVALRTVLPNLVTGGAIVFDHFHTTADYVETVGERIAAHEVLGDAGLLQLQGTGVFVKIA